MELGKEYVGTECGSMTEFEEKLEDDGATNVVSLKFPLPRKGFDVVKQLKIRDQDFRVRIKTSADTNYYLELSIEREDKRLEWKIDILLTFIKNDDYYIQMCDIYLDPGIAVGQIKTDPHWVSSNCHYIHAEFSLYLLRGESLWPDPDCTLICEEKEYFLSRACVSVFSDHLRELFSTYREENFHVDVCGRFELEKFLFYISRMFIHHIINIKRTYKAARRLLAPQLLLVDIEDRMVYMCQNVVIPEVVEYFKFAQKWNMPILAHVALARFELEDLETYKRVFKKFGSDVKKLYKQRKAELEERKKDEEREEKEIVEWIERQKKWYRTKKRRENRMKRKREKERRKKRKIMQKKRN